MKLNAGNWGKEVNEMDLKSKPAYLRMAIGQSLNIKFHCRELGSLVQN